MMPLNHVEICHYVVRASEEETRATPVVGDHFYHRVKIYIRFHISLILFATQIRASLPFVPLHA